MTIRNAVETDAEKICALFENSYSENYTKSYDFAWLTKQSLYFNKTEVLVKEEEEDILATAAINLAIGPHDDYVR